MTDDGHVHDAMGTESSGAHGLRDDALCPSSAESPGMQSEQRDISRLGAQPLVAKQLAASQFVHGLLEHVGRDDAARQDRRIAAVMHAIEAEDSRFRLLGPTRRWLVAATMLLTALLAVAFLAGLPAQNEAYAAVRASIAATRVAGDRSFTVRAVLPDPSFEPLPPAQLDIRDGDHQVFTATSPRGDVFVVGRNDRGTWAIRPDGSIDLYPPRHAWPRWMDFGEITFLADSTDDVLSQLPAGFTLRTAGAEPLPDTDGAACDRVSAVRLDTSGPDPARIELWIDRESRLVHRMELHWPERGSGRGGPGEAPPELLRKPRDGGPDAGRRGPRGDGMARGGGFAMTPPSPPSPPSPPAPPGDMPDGCGDLRPPPPGGPRRGPPHRNFVEGPPEFRKPGHPPPPKTIVFELRETQAFDDSWFEPTTHARRE